MTLLSTLLFVGAVLAFGAAIWKGRETRRDEGRMTGYISSLRATAGDYRRRVLELEQALAVKDQLLAAQDRLLEGQAAHLRSLDVDYAG